MKRNQHTWWLREGSASFITTTAIYALVGWITCDTPDAGGQ